MSTISNLSVIQQRHPKLDVEWLESIASTQQSVRANSLLVAEHQNAGVGRRGNHWLTPKGKAICFSYRFNLTATTQQMSGYALMVAVSITQVIEQFDESAGISQIKWPNDLYANDKKFAGILINLKPIKATPNQLDVIIGIGINWNLSADQLHSVNQAVCNIPLQNKPSRALFISRLIEQLNHNNQIYLQQGFTAFLSQWTKYDYLYDKVVRVIQEQGTVEGICAGIDEMGLLKVLVDGVMKHFSGGEVSVRAI